MSDVNYDGVNFNVLDRIVHAFHMQELLFGAKPYYNVFKQNPPTKEVCECARDVKHNGIKNILLASAVLFRQPPSFYGTNGSDALNFGFIEFLKKTSYKFLAQFAQDDKVDKEKILATTKEAIRFNEAPKSWQYWRKDFGKKEPAVWFDAALYLYCALHPY